MKIKITHWAAMLTTAIIMFVANPAKAFFYAGARQTVGNENYRGEYLYADFGGAWHLRPAFSAYHDDFSSGTYETISARLAYDSPHWGVGVTGGGTPRVNGYSNRFFGIDGILSIRPGEVDVPRVIDLEAPNEHIYVEDGNAETSTVPGWGLTRIDLGAGANRILHGENFQSGIFPSQTSTNIGETDYRGTVGVLLLRNYIGVDVTKSHYDHSLSASDLQAQVQDLAGLDFNIQGFPNTSVNIRLELTMVPVLVPFAAYSHTTFELAQPSLYAYTIGAYLRLIKFVELNMSYQRLVQSGEPDLNLLSLGASLRF